MNLINFPMKNQDNQLGYEENSNYQIRSSNQFGNNLLKSNNDYKLNQNNRNSHSIETNYSNNESNRINSNLNLNSNTNSYLNSNKNFKINSNFNILSKGNNNILKFVDINKDDENSFLSKTKNVNIGSNFYETSTIESGKKNNFELDDVKNTVLNDSNYHKDYKFPFKSLLLKIVSFILS